VTTVGGALHGGTLMALADTVGAAATPQPARVPHDDARVRPTLRAGKSGTVRAEPHRSIAAAHAGVADARDGRERQLLSLTIQTQMV